MDDDIRDAGTGKPRRHDGRDPWVVLSRERVAGDATIREAVPGSIAAAGEVGEAPSVAEGDGVLVVLERQMNDAQGRHEAVWCEVMAVDMDGLDAVFDNQPTWIRGVSSGDPVRLRLDQVLRVAKK